MVWISYVEDILTTRIEIKTDVHLKINVNKNPTRCNSMQTFIYCKVTLHVSGVTAHIIRSTKKLQFLVLLMMGAVTPETCRVTLQ